MIAGGSKLVTVMDLSEKSSNGFDRRPYRKSKSKSLRGWHRNLSIFFFFANLQVLKVKVVEMVTITDMPI